MRVFGLTGNIASGKSTVAVMFRDLGIPVLDADRISREVTVPGGRAYDAIVREFGTGIVGADGAIDRRKLGAIVFADPALRARLEGITHPAILEAMRSALDELARRGIPLAIVEAALIHESGRKGLLDSVIAVWCDAETQVRRLVKRDGISPEEATVRIRSQMDAERKADASDYVIDNSGDVEDTKRQVERLIRTLSGE